MLRRGIRPRSHLFCIRGYSGDSIRPQVCVALDELRRSPVVEPEQVVEDEHLAVGIRPGADPDHGDVEQRHQRLRHLGRHGFDDEQ